VEGKGKGMERVDNLRKTTSPSSYGWLRACTAAAAAAAAAATNDDDDDVCSMILSTLRCSYSPTVE